MSAVLVQAVLAHKSAKPEDEYVNDWVFLTTTTPATSTELTNIAVLLAAFYNDVQTGTSRSVANHMSTVIDRSTNASKFKMTLLDGHFDGSDHGSPVSVVQWTLGAAVAGAVNLPSELAVCLSYHSAYGSDPEFGPTSRPRARDRGRVYIGPCNNGFVVQDATTNRPYVSSNMRDTLKEAAADLIAATSPSWAQWSRAAATVDPVTGGWIDDAFDVQRRRGEDPTVRTTFGSTGLLSV